MERDNPLKGLMPLISETYTLRGEVVGYAFYVKVGGVDCTISAVTKKWAAHVEKDGEAMTDDDMANQYYILQNDDVIKNPNAVFEELSSVPNEQLKPLIVPIDPVYRVVAREQ